MARHDFDAQTARTFAFDDAEAALDYVGTGRARGKVVLEMP